MKTTKKTPAIKTEADGTKVCDLQAWRRDAYWAFARKEISRQEYEATVAALQARIETLQSK